MPSTLLQLKRQDENLDSYFDQLVALEIEVNGKTPQEVFELLWGLENGNLLLRHEAQRYVDRYLYSDAT